MRRIITIVTALCLLAGSVLAQGIQKGTEMQEMVRIAFTYRNAPYLSFDILYQYSDSTQPATIEEQISGKYKLNRNRFWAMLDSTEMIQGNNYNLAVHHDDKVIAVQKPQYSDNNVLQIPVMDSVFKQYIDSASVSTINDSTRLLKLFLKKNLPYAGYEIRYNPHGYLVRSIQYYMRGVPGDTTHTTGLIRIQLSNYSKEIISDDYFSESKFLYRDGNFYLRPEYSEYELMINGDL